MRLALAQLNPMVGDLAGNGERILAACSGSDSKRKGWVVDDRLLLEAWLERHTKSGPPSGHAGHTVRKVHRSQ